MSQQLYFLSGVYYPGALPILQPVLPVAVPQIPPNPLQGLLTFAGQNYPIPPRQISNPSALPPVPLERTTLIAHNTFWGVAQQSHFSYFAPPAPPMPYLPALPEQPVAAAAPASRKRPHPTDLHPREVAAAPVNQEKINPERMTTPAMSMDIEQMLKTRIYEGIALMEQLKFSESIQSFRQTFSLVPGICFAFHFIAGCQQVVNKIRPEILKHVKSALAINPNDPDSLLLKGLCYINPGQYQKAQKAFTAIVKNNPVDPMAKILLHEVSLMNRRIVRDSSVKRRMAISVLLNDDDTVEEKV
jgi:tetratricopeptide (TPR) repeat protein